MNTRYPLSDNMTVSITADSPYTHYVRIPGWAQTNGQGTISINSAAATKISVNSASLLAVPVEAGTTTFVLNLPADIEKTYGPTGGLQVGRGPLFWSSDIFHTNNVLATNAVIPLIYHNSSRSDAVI